jgi:hypothetical protein
MAIDRTPEEQEEYNRLKKDIIKDIKKETRKKDYNSSNKNTTSSSLTDIIKSRREAGEGVFSSLGGAAKERLKEKLDIRRALPQGGLLTALFPKLRAYKAQLLNTQSGESAGVGAAPAGGGDSLSSSKSLLDSISVSTKIISKNSMALPLIQKDTNLMRKTLVRIVKAMQARKKIRPVSRVTSTTAKTTASNATTNALEPEKEEEKKQNPIGDLLKKITGIFNDIGTKLTQILLDLPGKIVSGIVTGFKGLFTGVKIASAFLLSILKPLLSLVFSKAGLALLLAAGIFYSLYQLSKDYIKGKKISDELKSLIEKENEGTLTDPEKERLRALRLAQQSGQPGAVAGPKGQINLSLKQTMQPQVAEFIKKGLESNDPEDKTLAIEELKKFGLIGEKGIEVFNKYYQIMFTGNKKQNIIDFIEKNKQYGITNATLGSVAASMNYVQELVPQQKVKANQANDTLLSSNIDAEDAAAGAGMREMSFTPTNVINLPAGTTSIGPSITPTSPLPVSPSDDVGEFQMIPMTPPAKSETDEIGEIVNANENLMSAQDGPGQNQGFIGRRIDSPISNYHPDNVRMANAGKVELAYRST